MQAILLENDVIKLSNLTAKTNTTELVKAYLTLKKTKQSKTWKGKFFKRKLSGRATILAKLGYAEYTKLKEKNPEYAALYLNNIRQQVEFLRGI